MPAICKNCTDRWMDKFGFDWMKLKFSAEKRCFNHAYNSFTKRDSSVEIKYTYIGIKIAVDQFDHCDHFVNE